MGDVGEESQAPGDKRLVKVQGNGAVSICPGRDKGKCKVSEEVSAVNSDDRDGSKMHGEGAYVAAQGGKCSYKDVLRGAKGGYDGRSVENRDKVQDDSATTNREKQFGGWSLKR